MLEPIQVARRTIFLANLLVITLGLSHSLEAVINVGVDRIFTPPYQALVCNKRVGLITNHTGITTTYESTLALFERQHRNKKIQLVAIFAPEHGLFGEEHAGEKVLYSTTTSGIPIFSLYGETRRPTQQMLAKIDVLIYDIQDIGCRSYTFASTLFYVMEEAARSGIPVVVLDRPNPIGGLIVDGPMLESKFRSFVGYINIPYCHGMTIGELACLFNEEYHIGCTLHVVPMSGWKRNMRFEQTQLPWIPTSPNIPEHSSPFFYPATGLLGELSLVSIGIGSALPFKIVAAPWIDGPALAQKLNAGAPPGVRFQPIKIKPFSGMYSGKTCEGILILVTHWGSFNPITIQYWIFDSLKQMYPQATTEALRKMQTTTKFPMFTRLCGCQTIYDILLHEKRPYQQLRALHAKERAAFMNIRRKYLNPAYDHSQ